ncbi:MAG: hypothetical protein ACI8RD_001583 [Bacillariaceae sp.]|jgi:hypothetical protein
MLVASSGMTVEEADKKATVYAEDRFQEYKKRQKNVNIVKLKLGGSEIFEIFRF